MKMTLPKPQLILDYRQFFDVDPPKNRVSIIKGISREFILYELTALNHRLKPKDKIHYDISLEGQIRELEYFAKTDNIFNKYSIVAKKYTKNENVYPIIFNRHACAFAIEEIINSHEIETIDNYTSATAESWEAILKYLLAVNTEITNFKIEENNDFSFESLNPKLLPLNELLIEIDPIFTLFRGSQLIKYLVEQSNYQNEIKEYFNIKYGYEPHEFVYRLMDLYFANNSQNSEFKFFYSVQEGHQNLFDILSERQHNTETYNLLSIRKSPLIKVGHLKYLIADNSFLLEKIYQQLINDLWFEKLKESKKSIDTFRGEIGYFFEYYISQIMKICFQNYKHSILLMFDELKIKIEKDEIEIADLYLRYNNKILVGQVKSGSIYDKEKYGGDVESLYKNDRNKFFEKFGVDQIVESIRKIYIYMMTLDKKFPKGHSYEIFPCLIVNDKAFQTPIMANIFNIRFQELTVNLKLKKVLIRPLSLIHISDIEYLEEYIKNNPKEIWSILKYNFRYKKFIPPFYNTINQLVKRSVPKRAIEELKNLTIKYSPAHNSDNNFIT